MGQTVILKNVGICGEGGLTLPKMSKKGGGGEKLMKGRGAKKGGFCWKEGGAVSLIIFLARVWQM